MADGSFEKDLEKLESIVGALEEGGLSLDESLKQFELGIKLARRCEKALSEAEKRIEILSKKSDGELVAEPFEDEGDAPAPAESKSRARRTPPAEARGDDTTNAAEGDTTNAAEDDAGSDDEDEDDESGALLF